MSKNRRHNRWGTHSGAVTSKHGRAGPGKRDAALQERLAMRDERRVIHPEEEALWDDDARDDCTCDKHTGAAGEGEG